MQAVSVFTMSPSFNSHDSNNNFEIEYSQLPANFTSKLNLTAGSEGGFQFAEPEPAAALEDEEEKSEMEEKSKAQNADGDCENKDEDEDDFSFACTNPDGSPISADDIFRNGQIRPVFPIFNRDLLFADADDGDSARAREASSSSSSSLRPPLKRLFFEERDTPSCSASESDELEGVPEGTYCEWSRKPVEPAPELRNKSNSTGSSKLWRVRDLKLRCSSDGKDAFVFLNPNSTSGPKPSEESAADDKSSVKIVRTVAKPKAKGQVKKVETVSSAHEKHYVRNRAIKEGDKRRSYLPYRPGLVGFFTNVNGLSRNVHPF